MSDILSYYFTIYGEVYVGEKFDEFLYPDHTILIQRSKIREYNDIPYQQKCLDKIYEYGYAIPNHVIARHERFPKEIYQKAQNVSDRRLWEDYDRKVMFIIGAGASANCVFGNDKEEFKKSQNCPPLGPSLFDKRFATFYDKYPGVKRIFIFSAG